MSIQIHLEINRSLFQPCKSRDTFSKSNRTAIQSRISTCAIFRRFADGGSENLSLKRIGERGGEVEVENDAVEGDETGML
jgi:hypothetical protein